MAAKGDFEGVILDAVAILTGVTNSTPLNVSGLDRITFCIRLAATVVAADLTLVIKPYDQKGVLLNPTALGLTAEASMVVTSDGTDVVGMFSYALRGLKQIRVDVKNANAGTKSASCSYFATPINS